MNAAPRGWRGLSGKDRLTLVALAAAVAGVRMALGWWGMRRTVSALARWMPLRSTNALHGDAAMAHARRLARLADVAGRHGPVDAACLPQAVLVQALLRQRGIETRLQLGLPPPERAVADAERPFAHAWLELDGRPLLERDIAAPCNPFALQPGPFTR